MWVSPSAMFHCQELVSPLWWRETLRWNIISLLYPVRSDCFQQVNGLDDVLHTSLVEHIGFISVTCMSVITNVRNVWFIDAQSHRNQSRERWEDKLKSCFLFFIILLMHRWLPQIEGTFQKHLSRLVIAAFEGPFVHTNNRLNENVSVCWSK